VTDSIEIMLSPEQRQALNTVIDMIIPSSPDGAKPAASHYDIWGYVCEAAGNDAAQIQTDLDLLLEHATEYLDTAFARLTETQQIELVKSLRSSNDDFLSTLARQTVCCYYQQDEVLEAIGMEARAPFPKGYVVEQGDLSLLEPVRARGKIYRDVD